MATTFQRHHDKVLTKPSLNKVKDMVDMLSEEEHQGGKGPNEESSAISSSSQTPSLTWRNLALPSLTDSLAIFDSAKEKININI